MVVGAQLPNGHLESAGLLHDLSVPRSDLVEIRNSRRNFNHAAHANALTWLVIVVIRDRVHDLAHLVNADLVEDGASDVVRDDERALLKRALNDFLGVPHAQLVNMILVPVPGVAGPVVPATTERAASEQQQLAFASTLHSRRDDVVRAILGRQRDRRGRGGLSGRHRIARRSLGRGPERARELYFIWTGPMEAMKRSGFAAREISWETVSKLQASV
jgi:hypothetical protein